MHLKPSSTSSSVSRSPAMAPLRETPTRPRFLSVLTAAAILGTSEVTLYRAIHGKQFPAIKIRGRYVIPAKALDAMEEIALETWSVVNASDWVDGGQSA